MIVTSYKTFVAYGSYMWWSSTYVPRINIQHAHMTTVMYHITTFLPALFLRIANTSVCPIRHRDGEGTVKLCRIRQLVCSRYGVIRADLLAVHYVYVSLFRLLARLRVVVEETVGLEHKPSLLPRLVAFTCVGVEKSRFTSLSVASCIYLPHFVI